jgi:hypothetical protein
MKFLKQHPIEFYVSVAGYLVFKNYEITIALTPDQTKVLQNQLPEIIELQKEHWTGVEKDDPQRSNENLG